MNGILNLGPAIDPFLYKYRTVLGISQSVIGAWNISRHTLIIGHQTEENCDSQLPSTYSVQYFGDEAIILSSGYRNSAISHYGKNAVVHCDETLL